MTHLPLFIPTLGMPEIIVIGLIFAFIWGGKKLPELGRGIGGFFKNLKEGVSGEEE
ncbi:MAG: Sec-independent protein translocase subunit TatA/TatB [Candidatus Thorarchaeota archaeon]